MSLRLRLLIGILALAAAGLLVLDVVSYKVLEDHLGERVDQQVESASRPLAAALRAKADPEFQALRGRLPAELGAGGERPGGAPEEGDGASVPRPPDELPPGTFGQLRSADGEVLATVSFDYGDEDLARPDLGGSLPVASFDEPMRTVTVGSRQGDGQFRVGATEGPDGLVTIAAIPLGDNEETLEQLALIEAIVTVSVLLAIAGLAWWVIGVGLTPLRKMSATADEIAQGDLSRRVEDASPKTEVGRLGIALNAMLAQIEEAFRQREESEARMRRFLADASHELRTPLVSIRGYSELYRLGAIDSPAELDSAMRRIESESGRMGTLVDDLLALARMDEMPAPAKPERVDLAEILAELVADLRVVAPGRRVSLDAAGDLSVSGDPDQLRRAIRNVLRNAVTHTDDGTPIEVAATEDAGTIKVEVRDHGPGIPAGAEHDVFERFWRGSESRSRDDGGAGIGLALVSAILRGHGGSATAANADSGGAVFTLRIPST